MKFKSTSRCTKEGLGVYVLLGCRSQVRHPIHTVEAIRLAELICRRGDSNPHELPHTPLKRARLPVPPLRHEVSLEGPAIIAGKFSIKEHVHQDHANKQQTTCSVPVMRPGLLVMLVALEPVSELELASQPVHSQTARPSVNP